MITGQPTDKQMNAFPPPPATNDSSKITFVIKELLKPLWHYFERLSKWKRRLGLKYKDFSIISNNCCGGYVYQFFGISYKTPTEGNFMCVNDYLKLIKDPKYYFNQTPIFIEPNSTDLYKSGVHFTYPVARIGDITIYFMHYHSKEEAESKWKRRSHRINYNKLFFLLSETETMGDNHPKEFCEFLKSTGAHGILLTTKDTQLDHVKTIKNVPTTVDGVPQWIPDIVINSIEWKKTINHL